MLVSAIGGLMKQLKLCSLRLTHSSHILRLLLWFVVFVLPLFHLASFL